MNFFKWKFSKIFVVILVLLIAAGTIYFCVGSGTKEKRYAKEFLKKISDKDMISEEINDFTCHTSKKTDPKTQEVYYNVIIENYIIAVDKKGNIRSFSNPNAAMTSVKVGQEEAVKLADNYLSEIYDEEYIFDSIIDKDDNNPYYTVVFSKAKDGYRIYGYKLSLNINKESGKLDGYANPSLNKDIKDIKINADMESGYKMALNEFKNIYKEGSIDNCYEGYYGESNDDTLELCYIIDVKGKDENNKDIKIRYFVSTDSGVIRASEKITVDNTKA